jgi:HAD superfamily hydrolase (TIGR01509 family)
MNWIDRFDLFLFDFDGLLVNTEHLHYQAYLSMLEARGCNIDWGFTEFARAAHLNQNAIREGICVACPSLRQIPWETLYREKKEAYESLLLSGKIELMSGVAPLLEALASSGKRRAVATNSFRIQTQLIRSQLPILQTLEHWICREDYENAKPAPDAYLTAIELHGQKGDRIIGFEDSIRGLRALQASPAFPVLICPSHHPLFEIAGEGVCHYESFDLIPPSGP